MKVLITIALLLFTTSTFSQAKKTELYDLLKKLIQDSTEYSSAGDWAVGSPKAYPVRWEEDRLIMSDDITINFYRKGTANISVNGNSYSNANKPIPWNIMLKGPRMGFTSFSIESAPHKDLHAKTIIDSLMGKNPFTYKLLQDCSAGAGSGFYYYRVNLPKKVTAWVKLSWNCSAGNCSLALDCYDDWSRQYAVLKCSK